MQSLEEFNIDLSYNEDLNKYYAEFFCIDLSNMVNKMDKLNNLNIKLESNTYTLNKKDLINLKKFSYNYLQKNINNKLKISVPLNNKKEFLNT